MFGTRDLILKISRTTGFWMLGWLRQLLSLLLAKVSGADLFGCIGHKAASLLLPPDKMLHGSILCGGVWNGTLLGTS